MAAARNRKTERSRGTKRTSRTARRTGLREGCAARASVTEQLKNSVYSRQFHPRNARPSASLVFFLVILRRAAGKYTPRAENKPRVLPRPAIRYPPPHKYRREYRGPRIRSGGQPFGYRKNIFRREEFRVLMKFLRPPFSRGNYPRKAGRINNLSFARSNSRNSFKVSAAL